MNLNDFLHLLGGASPFAQQAYQQEWQQQQQFAQQQAHSQQFEAQMNQQRAQQAAQQKNKPTMPFVARLPVVDAEYVVLEGR